MRPTTNSAVGPLALLCLYVTVPKSHNRHAATLVQPHTFSASMQGLCVHVGATLLLPPLALRPLFRADREVKTMPEEEKKSNIRRREKRCCHIDSRYSGHFPLSLSIAVVLRLPSSDLSRFTRMIRFSAK